MTEELFRSNVIPTILLFQASTSVEPRLPSTPDIPVSHDIPDVEAFLLHLTEKLQGYNSKRVSFRVLYLCGYTYYRCIVWAIHIDRHMPKGERQL